VAALTKAGWCVIITCVVDIQASVELFKVTTLWLTLTSHTN